MNVVVFDYIIVHKPKPPSNEAKMTETGEWLKNDPSALRRSQQTGFRPVLYVTSL